MKIGVDVALPANLECLDVEVPDVGVVTLLSVKVKAMGV